MEDSNTSKPKSTWSKMKTKFSSHKSHSKHIPSVPAASNMQTLSTVASSPQQLQSSSPAEACQGPQPSPIIELWDEAYNDLSREKKGLMLEFEGILSKTLAGSIAAAARQASSVGFSGLGKVQRRQQMQVLLDQKIKDVEEGAWKLLSFKNRQVLVKDLVKPVVGIIEFAKDYVGKAVEVSPYGSIAWAGVCLLLPLILNPSEQGKAHVKALDEVASIISQCTMREILYHRRYESGSYQNLTSESKVIHGQYKNALKMLYVKILGFHVSSICFLSKHTPSRVMEELLKWNDWNSMLAEIHGQEAVLRLTEDHWRDMKYDEECNLLKDRHEKYMERLNLMEDDKRQLRMLIHDQQTSSERRDFLSWLSSVDPSTNYNSAREKHTLSTSQWLVDGNVDFKHWVDAPNSHLWLSGKVGAGKSVLCSAAIHHLYQLYDSEPYTALAYFYFSFGDSAKQSTENMLRSIIKQLCSRRPDIPPASSKLRRFREINHQPDNESLENAFKESAHDFTRVYVIIDALDECPLQQRNTLLDVLLNIQKLGLTNLHILYSSRQEPDIELMFRPSISRHDITEINLETRRQEINKDIRIYIDKEIASPSFDSWPPSIKENAKTALVGKAHGMFQYVSLQLAALKLAKSTRAVEKALADLPDGLDETYNRALLNINPNHWPHAIRTLKWLSFSIRPLRLGELAEASVINPKSTTFDTGLKLFTAADVLNFLPGGLVIVRGGTDETDVTLAHFSVKEFLVSSRIRAGPASIFFMSSDEAHQHIAECCMVYHLHTSRGSDHILALKDIEHHFPLCIYSAQFWIDHVEILSRDCWPASLIELMERALGVCTESLRTMVQIWVMLAHTDESSVSRGLGSEVYVSPIYFAIYERYLQSVSLDWTRSSYELRFLDHKHQTFLKLITANSTPTVQSHDRMTGLLFKALGRQPQENLIQVFAMYCSRSQSSGFCDFVRPFPPTAFNLRLYWSSIDLPYWNFDTLIWFLRQTCGLASALKTIHSFEVNSVSLGHHGDLVPESVLWSESPTDHGNGGVLQIADLAIQRLLRILSLRSRDINLNMNSYATYIPPEIALDQLGAGNSASPSCDIFSLGCVFLEFVTWLLKGSSGLIRFCDSRGMLAEDEIYDDWYVTLIGSVDRTSSDPHVEIRRGVIDWIDSLRRGTRCSEMCNDFLDLIEKDMLKVDPNARISADSLTQKMERMVARGENDMEYLLGNKAVIDTDAGIKLPPVQSKIKSS